MYFYFPKYVQVCVWLLQCDVTSGATYSNATAQQDIHCGSKVPFASAHTCMLNFDEDGSDSDKETKLAKDG